MHCVALCCNVLRQYTPLASMRPKRLNDRVCVLQCVAVCYNVLQFVAVCCRVLQCVAVRFSALLRVAAAFCLYL